MNMDPTNQAETGIKLLWGTQNMFSHKRYMNGAATNPDAHVFAYAAAQTKKVRCFGGFNVGNLGDWWSG